MVQVRNTPAGTIKATIRSIKPIGRTTTYDIGVKKNHNFFANHVLVHNCHHDCADSMAHQHNLVNPDWVLGLSATPFRTDKMKLCFDNVVRDSGIHSLIQDGWLSPYDHYSIPEWSPQAVADVYCSDPERWGKSAFYFLTHDECNELATIFQQRGIKYEIVTGSSDREDQLERFRAGEYNCLLNCAVLTEGWDEPSLKTAWIRDSGRGPTMQMGGRVFRLYEHLPVKQIVQSLNTRWPFVKTAMARQQYVLRDGNWLTLTVNPKINQIYHNTLHMIATTVVSLPDVITKHQGKAGRRRRRNRF